MTERGEPCLPGEPAGLQTRTKVAIDVSTVMLGDFEVPVPSLAQERGVPSSRAAPSSIGPPPCGNV